MMAVLAIVLTATAATAQVTISGGLGWSGGYGIGDASADLRTNAAGVSPPPFTLFEVDSRMAASPGFEVRGGFPITRDLMVEGGAQFARRRLSFRISRDAEAPSQTFEGESLQHFVFDAAVLWRVPRIPYTRLRGFAMGGVGYLRQLHQDRTRVESGQIYYLGGSARYWLRGLPESHRSMGVRGDLRVNLKRNGIDFANETRVYPTLLISLFLVL